MTRAKVRHLRERASSVLFDAYRVSNVRCSPPFFMPPVPPGGEWLAHPPVVKRGQKR